MVQLVLVSSPPRKRAVHKQCIVHSNVDKADSSPRTTERARARFSGTGESTRSQHQMMAKMVARDQDHIGPAGPEAGEARLDAVDSAVDGDDVVNDIIHLR